MSSEELKQAGLKVTLPRMKILEILQEQGGQDHHMTAEDIYRALIHAGEEIGLATVYRVLTQFESAGLIKRHYFEGNQSFFELNEGGPHDHIVCLDCGAIFEFHDELVDRRQKEIATDQGFTLSDRSLILYAHCVRHPCANRDAAQAEKSS